MVAGALALCVPSARAQSTSGGGAEAAGSEIQVWTGGGSAVPGGAQNTGVWNLGFRYGWVLTGPHGPGFLRGRFEYAVDAVPMFLVFQPSGTAYGAGLNPVAVKWNFDAGSRVKPYLDITEGVLFTNILVPAGTSHVNFDSSFALGLNVPHGRYHWNVEVRYMHISNAGLTNPNPGLNTIQFRLGLGLFTGHRK